MSAKSLSPFRLRPAHGTCRWIDRGCGVLQINGVRYTVIRVAGRYRLLNWDNGNVSDIGADQQCTCPSFLWDHCPVQAGGGAPGALLTEETQEALGRLTRLR